jgi:hypothetical protein
MLSSTLWTSYTYSTSGSAKDQESAWDKADRSNSLSPFTHNRPTRLVVARGRLGLTAGRVHEALTDEPTTVAGLAQRAGLSGRAPHRAVVRLADVCLAGVMPGRPVRYFAVEAPMGVLAQALGCDGTYPGVSRLTEILQAENREKYAGAYRHDTQSPQPEVRRQVPRPRARPKPRPAPAGWTQEVEGWLERMSDRLDDPDPRTIPDPFTGAPPTLSGSL